MWGFVIIVFDFLGLCRVCVGLCYSFVIVLLDLLACVQFVQRFVTVLV